MPQPIAIVVEDQQHDVDHVSALLEPHGFEIVHARTILEGEDSALERFAPSHNATGCLLVDMHLPLPHDARGIDGYYLISTLDKARAEGRMRAVPIVAVSADWTPERWTRAQHAGADCIWEKPLGPEEIAILCEFVVGVVPSNPMTVERATMGMVARDLLDFLRRTMRSTVASSAEPGQAWTGDDVRILIGYFTPAIRINAVEKAHIRAKMSESPAVMRQRLHRGIEWFTEQDLGVYAQCLRYLLSGVTQEALGRRLGYRRVKLTNTLTRLYDQLAIYLTTQR